MGKIVMLLTFGAAVRVKTIKLLRYLSSAADHLLAQISPYLN